jgi:hypothetical protein
VIETWKEINAVQQRQKADPTYKNIVALPPTANPSPAVAASV